MRTNLRAKEYCSKKKSRIRLSALIWQALQALFCLKHFPRRKELKTQTNQTAPFPCEGSLAIMYTNRLPARARLNLQLSRRICKVKVPFFG